MTSRQVKTSTSEARPCEIPMMNILAQGHEKGKDPILKSIRPNKLIPGRVPSNFVQHGTPSWSSPTAARPPRHPTASPS